MIKHLEIYLHLAHAHEPTQYKPYWISLVFWDPITIEGKDGEQLSYVYSFCGNAGNWRMIESVAELEILVREGKIKNLCIIINIDKFSYFINGNIDII